MNPKHPLPTPLQAFIVLGAFLTLACTFTTLLNLPVLLALLFGWFIVIALGLHLGYSYRELEESAGFGIFEGMPALLILFAVGAMTGTWIVGGIVPGIIYFGLATIHPDFFLPATLFICALTSLATGTSWGAAGTAGIAMMGIGDGLGIPPPITAGAVLSGAYFGDKLSPLSDSVLLASSMARVEIRAHIKGLLPISLVSFLLTAILFTVTGLFFIGSHYSDAHIKGIMVLLQQRFDINLMTFIPPAVVLFLLATRRPAFPTILFGAALGVIWAIVWQKQLPADALAAFWGVPIVNSGHVFIDNLLSRGGIGSIMSSVAMITFGLGFGSLLVKVGIVKLFANSLDRFVRNEATLTGTTLLTGFSWQPVR